MASNIDETKPATGAPTTSSVRANFAAAKSEIEALQTGKSDTGHGHSISDVSGLQTALDGKQDDLVSGTTIKTINGSSILGSGDITISGGASPIKGRVYTVAGWLPTYLKEGRVFWVPETNIEILDTFFFIGDPSTTSGCVAYVKKNGAIIAELTTAASIYKSSSVVPSVSTVTPNDSITVDVQCTSGGAKNMTVHIRYQSTT